MVFINHMEVLSGDAAIVEVDGPLNSETSPDFEEYINQLLVRDTVYILLDAGKIEFISSEGIGVTLYIQKKISENNGYFVIYNLTEEVLSLYKILGFDKVFNIASSKINAMQIMDRQMELRTGEKPEDKAEDLQNTYSDLIDSSKPAEDDNDLYDFNNEHQEDSEIQGFDIEIFDDGKEFTASVAGDGSAGDSGKFDSFVVECVKCKSFVRVKQSGDYLCPSCSTEFHVNEDRKVSFS